MEELNIGTDYITLGQFLKLADLIQSGGHARFFLQENNVLVNGEFENRRGRKLYPEDTIEVDDFGQFLIKKEN